MMPLVALLPRCRLRTPRHLPLHSPTPQLRLPLPGRPPPPTTHPPPPHHPPHHHHHPTHPTPPAPHPHPLSLLQPVLFKSWSDPPSAGVRVKTIFWDENCPPACPPACATWLPRPAHRAAARRVLQPSCEAVPAHAHAVAAVAAAAAAAGGNGSGRRQRQAWRAELSCGGWVRHTGPLISDALQQP